MDKPSIRGELNVPLTLIAGADLHACEEFCEGMMEKFLANIEESAEQKAIFTGVDKAIEPQLTPVEHLGALLRKFVESNGFFQKVEFLSGSENQFHHVAQISRYDAEFKFEWLVTAHLQVTTH